jgi:hypothetical protein
LGLAALGVAFRGHWRSFGGLKRGQETAAKWAAPTAARLSPPIVFSAKTRRFRSRAILDFCGLRAWLAAKKFALMPFQQLAKAGGVAEP